MKLQRMTLVLTTTAALLFFLTLGAAPAAANLVTYQLTSDHCSGSGGCLGNNPSAGTIAVNDISGGVTITVTLIPGYLFNHGGQDADFGFNLSGNPTISGSVNPNDWHLNSTNAGTLHLDGTGDFSYGFTGNWQMGGGHGQPGPYTFTVLGSGVSTSSFVQNTSNQFFALDIFGNGNTGFVDASSPGVVPDGGMTVMLLGSSLVGIAMLRRKFMA